MRILGIDEAGRGCVLGPLVIAGFFREMDDDTALLEAGAADSKQLSGKKRWVAREALMALGTPDVRRVNATEIDAGNLNALEEGVIVDLIKKWRPNKVIIDALGHPRTLPALQRRLAVAVGEPQPTEWLIEPKADHNHPVVGAASIFAKTTRDADLEELTAPYGDLGSGYPSDPKTRAWLAAWAQERKSWPSFVRTRWGTIRDLAQATLF